MRTLTFAFCSDPVKSIIRFFQSFFFLLVRFLFSFSFFFFHLFFFFHQFPENYRKNENIDKPLNIESHSTSRTKALIRKVDKTRKRKGERGCLCTSRGVVDQTTRIDPTTLDSPGQSRTKDHTSNLHIKAKPFNPLTTASFYLSVPKIPRPFELTVDKILRLFHGPCQKY